MPMLTVTTWLHVKRGAHSSIPSSLTQLITGISFQRNAYKSDGFLLLLTRFGRKAHFKGKEKAYTSAKDSQKMKEGDNNPSGNFARIPKAPK